MAMVTQAGSLHLMEDHVGAHIYLQDVSTCTQGGPQAAADAQPMEELQPGEILCRSRFSGAAFHGGPTLKQSVPCGKEPCGVNLEEP